MDAPRPSVEKTAVLTLEEASWSTTGRSAQTYTMETATSDRALRRCTEMADGALRPCTE